MDDLEWAPGRVIPKRDLSFDAVRASGPGGQNVNKVATKVRLAFDLRGNCTLRAEHKARLRTLAARHLDSAGALVLTDDTTRSQATNLDRARERLGALIADAAKRPKRRKPTKPSRGAVRRRLADKRKHSEKKASRRRGADEG